MPVFSKMSTWPVGYFRAASAWLLRERRDVARRVAVLSAELTRIGFVRVFYQTTREGDSTLCTENRTGFAVTRGSSLARLVQAYIANGGNPFDISGFLHPDQTLIAVGEGGDMSFRQQYPGGGVVAPKSASYNAVPELVTTEDGKTEPVKSGYEGYEGGYLNTDRYYPARMGGRLDRGAWDSNTIVRTMHEMRAWANQTIRERLSDIEWRIIKLSDLHEQLIHERDQVLVQAFGNTLFGLAGVDDDEQYDKALMMQSLIADMYALIFETGEGGFPVGFRPSTEVAFLHFTFEDKPSEATSGP